MSEDEANLNEPEPNEPDEADREPASAEQRIRWFTRRHALITAGIIALVLVIGALLTVVVYR
jgi:hypothetical protein